jgi:hypothetical protein
MSPSSSDRKKPRLDRVDRLLEGVPSAGSSPGARKGRGSSQAPSPCLGAPVDLPRQRVRGGFHAPAETIGSLRNGGRAGKQSPCDGGAGKRASKRATVGGGRGHGRTLPHRVFRRAGFRHLANALKPTAPLPMIPSPVQRIP